MSGTGLIPAIQTMSNVKDERFLKVGVPIVSPTLVSPIALQSADAASVGFLTVGTAAEGAYEGAISIQPGPNTAAPTGNQVGITVRATADGVAVDIGDNAQPVNELFISGPDGSSQVYDEKYNQPVALQNITLTNVSPTNVVDTANPGEIFRCDQAGVLASATSAIGCRIQVPRTGFYMVAAEVKLGNAPAPAATSIVVPINVATGGFNIGESLTMSFVGPNPATTITPYSLMDINSLDFSQLQILTQNDGPVRQYTWMQKFDSTETYTFLFKAGSALWNIGPAGQIKVELIAMC
jgi:hypothetical protein